MGLFDFAINIGKKLFDTASEVPAALKKLRHQMTKHNQHVVPHEGKWVKSAGSGKPASVHKTQYEAIEHAREFAKKQGTMLFIHAHDGHIRELHDYRK